MNNGYFLSHLFQLFNRDGTKAEPTFTVDKSWGDDWAKFKTFAAGTTQIAAKVSDDTHVTFNIKFSSGDIETYTITYPDGVPEGLGFYVGADGGKITITNVETVETVAWIEGTKPGTSTGTGTGTGNGGTGNGGGGTVTQTVLPSKLTVKETAGYDNVKSYTLVKGKKVVITTVLTPAKATNKKIKAKVNNKNVTVTVKVGKKAKATVKITVK